MSTSAYRLKRVDRPLEAETVNNKTGKIKIARLDN